MQTMKDYSGNRAPVKPGGTGTTGTGTTGTSTTGTSTTGTSTTGTSTTGTGQRVECRINTRRGTLRLAGSMAEVTGWLRAQCPGGKLCELVEVQ